jgi:hypothetical protein
MVLGIAGVRALQAMKIEPTVFHSNEGHSAFIGLERLRYYIVEKKLSFEVAREIVGSSTLFTTIPRYRPVMMMLSPKTCCGCLYLSLPRATQYQMGKTLSPSDVLIRTTLPRNSP